MKKAIYKTGDYIIDQRFFKNPEKIVEIIYNDWQKIYYYETEKSDNWIPEGHAKLTISANELNEIKNKN